MRIIFSWPPMNHRVVNLFGHIMRYNLILILILAGALQLGAQQQSFYDFTLQDIDGRDMALSTLKGKKVLVVNVASKCGYTPQYEALEKLYEQYSAAGFTIVAFPANNFRGQEPGSNEEIKSFCTSTYHVTFPMMAKISVKGDDIHPLYTWLTRKDQNGVMDAPVTWNFQKFMIDENGRLAGMVDPSTPPDCDKIVNWITGKK